MQKSTITSHFFPINWNWILKHIFVFWILIIYLFYSSVHAQTILLQPPSGGLVATDCWNIQINNQQKEERVYLMGKIKDDKGQIVCELKSATIKLIKGNNILSKEIVHTAKLNYLNDQVERAVLQDGNFPKGQYELCTIIYSSDRIQEMSTSCLNVSVNPQLIHKDDRSDDYKKISFYGTAAVDAVYLSPNPEYRLQPSSFLRLQFDPAFSVYSIPVLGQFRYTTEETGPYRELDMFSVRFDRLKFEQNLKHLVLRKLAETQYGKLKEQAGNLEKLNERDNLEALIKDKGTELIEKQIKLVKDSIQQLKNNGTDAQKPKLEKLETRYKLLLAKKNQIDKLKSRFKQLEAFKNNLQQSGKLDELKNLAENPPDLNDPKILIGQLKQYGAFKGVNKILFNLKEISIGTCYPFYSPLTINGAQIIGANVEWNPSWFFLGATTGIVNNTIPFSIDSSLAAYKQKMLGLRLGFGKIYSTHISFNALRFWDQQSSIPVTPQQELYPESLWVGSTDFLLSIGKTRIIELSGEMAGLFKNQNTLDTLSYPIQALSSGIVNQLNPNFSSNVDFAYNSVLSLNLFKQNTKLSAGINFVGPGYIHPGAYGLPNDLMRQEFRFEQFLAKRKFKFSLFTNLNHDNFSESKGITTKTKEYGSEFDIASKKFAQIRLRLSRNEMNSPLYFFNSNIANLTLSKSLRISKLASSNTIVNGMYYFTKTDSVNQNLNSFYFFLQQNFSLPKGYSISLGGQYAKNTIGAINNQNTGFNVQVGKLLFKRIRLSLGSNYNAISVDHKLGFAFDLSGNIIKNLQLNIRANRNQFSSYPGTLGRYQENYIQSGIKFSW